MKCQWPYDKEPKKLGAGAVFDQVTSESSLVYTRYDFDELPPSPTMMIDIDDPSTFYFMRKEELDDSNFRVLVTVPLTLVDYYYSGELSYMALIWPPLPVANRNQNPELFSTAYSSDLDEVRNELLEADFHQLPSHMSHGVIFCIGGYPKTPLSIHFRFHPLTHWQALNGNLYPSVRVFTKGQHPQEGLDPSSLRILSSWFASSFSGGDKGI